MRVVGTSNPGLVRGNNEDSYAIRRDLGLLLVADGMGGHAAGEEASRLAVRTIVRSLENWQGQPEEGVKEALEAANRGILAKAAAVPALAGMGTTCTLVLVLPEYLITGQIGDSMAFLIDSDFRPLTGDHSVSGQLLAAGKITREEAAQHPQRHVLTRALGIDTCPEIEVGRHRWQPGQKLLLCTDGLTEVVLPQEMHKAATGSGGLRTRVSALLGLALERGAPDNVTIILARL